MPCLYFQDKLVHRYEIPKHLYEERSILVTPVVECGDPEGSCQDTFVYVADCQTYSIIVHDVRRNTAWRATDKTMYPYPNYGTFDIQGKILCIRIRTDDRFVILVLLILYF